MRKIALGYVSLMISLGACSSGDTGSSAPDSAPAPTTDTGHVTSPTDTGSVSDTAAATDTGSAADTHMALDSGVGDDTSVSTDTGTLADTGIVADTGIAADTHGTSDTAVATDTSTPADTHVAADTSVATDSHVTDAPATETAVQDTATDSSSSGTCGGGSAQSSDITINESSVQQKISGFGVSSAWAGNYNNASDPTYLWSTTTGAGLTLLRIRYGDGLTIAKSAATYPDVKVWMTVWGTGTNGNQGGANTTTQTNPNGCTNGSMPVLTNPTAEASEIASFVTNAKSQGVPIYAVSGANEPDSCGINSTTSYSAAQLATWIDTLGPAMTTIGVKNMAPETMNGYGFPGYFTEIQNNSAAWNAVDIFASHEYGLAPPVQPAIAAAGKEYWETEVDTGTASGDPSGDGIASALLMAQAIHSDLTTRNLNAWHLWWLYESGNSGGCLYDTGSKVWTKRLWVMGNFSRFVRPGYTRVSTSGTSPSGVLVSAYTNPTTNALSIVAINSNTSSSKESFYLSANAPCTLTPYETSAANSLGQLTPVTVASSRVTVTLSAQSVTTFVGTP